MPYDPNSGLAFSEAVIKQSRKRIYQTKRQTKSLGGRLKYIPPEHGPATLVELSMLTILRSLDMLDDNSLSTVPPTVLEKIWKSITRSQLDSLHVWKLFARSSIGHTSIMQARSPLVVETIGTAVFKSSSTDCSWITSLNITNHDIPLEELVLVPKLDNLRSFLMATARKTPADMGVNDRVLRSWAESARENGALQHLRFVFLYRQLGVTKWCLRHLDAFPKLDEFCAYDCGIQKRDVKCRRQGWRQSPEGSFFAFVEASVAHRQQMEVYMAFFPPTPWNRLAADYIRAELRSSSEEIDRRPLLQIRLGAEVTALSHRLDDPSDIVCLKCGSESHVVKEEVPVERRDPRPLVKRRKIVFDSGDLDGMLGG